MPPATAKPHDYDNVDMAYPSRTIAFQAAGMITSIMENLLAHDQVKYQPAFMYVCAHKLPARLLTFLQCVQFVLGFDHACVSNAFLGAVGSGSQPRTHQRVHGCIERSVQSVASGKDGSYPV